MTEIVGDFARLFIASGAAVLALVLIRWAWRLATWSKRDLEAWADGKR